MGTRTLLMVLEVLLLTHSSQSLEVMLTLMMDWTVNKYKGVSLLQSVAHELGHSLGLLHSSKYGAMMSPYHKGWTPNLSLDSDDIRAVRKLYGNQVLRAKSSRSSPYKRPTTRKTTTRKPRNYYYYELLKK